MRRSQSGEERSSRREAKRESTTLAAVRFTASAAAKYSVRAPPSV